MPEIILDENTSVRNIHALKEKLLDAVSTNEEVLLDFSNLERVDLSVVQLVLAALKSVRQNGQTIKFKHVSDGIRSQFQLAGLMKKGKE
ncbi:MAG: STAS domain-containing protein [Spirochaetota bacterium]